MIQIVTPRMLDVEPAPVGVPPPKQISNNRPNMVLTDDQIDYQAYLAEPEAKQSVKPVSHWRDRVVQQFLCPDEQRGVFLPWRKASGLLRLRRGELTLWPGINGHGKSGLLGQVMICAAAQGEKVLIASMEMRPVATISRMVRQATKQRDPSIPMIDEFHQWSDERIWIYDHLGSVDWRKLIAAFRWAADKLGIKQFVIDSLMRCGIAEDDYNGQKQFVDALCTFKHDYDVSVHLVLHSRKRDDEMTPPGKFDAKGTGTMSDLADNVMTVWRNKRKEREWEKSIQKPEIMNEPDALLICDKQRNFDWEGRITLWYHRDSMQFVETLGANPYNLMEIGT